MKFISYVVIILVFICLTNSLPINKYYIEDYCRQEFVSLSPDHSNPIRLYLSRTKPISFDLSYCIITFNTSENFSMEMEGYLGQLMLKEDSSDEKRFHFTFNSSITENVHIFRKIFAKKLIVIVENNEILTKNQSNDNLMDTELEFRAVFKNENFDCDESNEPCMNTEEELEESSGEHPLNYECTGNECSGESYAECEDYESNCTTNHQKRGSDKTLAPVLDLRSTSGSIHLALNEFLIILCSLFWLQFH